MIEAYGLSDLGKKRQRNEDSFVVNAEINLFLVADGMGGHNAGDVASATAAKTIENFMIHSHQERELTWPFGLDPQMNLDGNRLRTAIKLANHKIWRLADSNQEYTGMGTTVVCAVVSEDTASIGSVGDSRAYLIRGQEMKVLTRDDVWFNETWVRKVFTEDQLQNMPLKNILSKAVGSKEDIDFPVLEVPFHSRDILLLCSDGLHGLVEDEQLLSAAQEKGTKLEEMCRTMVALANKAGGKDNITVVAVRYSQ